MLLVTGATAVTIYGWRRHDGDMHNIDQH